MKYAEEKWILHRDAEPHRVNFKSFFFVWYFGFLKKKGTTNRISNLVTYKSATRRPVTQTQKHPFKWNNTH